MESANRSLDNNAEEKNNLPGLMKDLDLLNKEEKDLISKKIEKIETKLDFKPFSSFGKKIESLPSLVDKYINGEKKAEGENFSLEIYGANKAPHTGPSGGPSGSITYGGSSYWNGLKIFDKNDKENPLHETGLQLWRDGQSKTNETYVHQIIGPSIIEETDNSVKFGYRGGTGYVTIQEFKKDSKELKTLEKFDYSKWLTNKELNIEEPADIKKWIRTYTGDYGLEEVRDFDKSRFKDDIEIYISDRANRDFDATEWKYKLFVHKKGKGIAEQYLDRGKNTLFKMVDYKNGFLLKSIKGMSFEKPFSLNENTESGPHETLDEITAKLKEIEKKKASILEEMSSQIKILPAAAENFHYSFKTSMSPVFKKPEDVKWETMNEFVEYQDARKENLYINPETQNLDFDKLESFIPKNPDWVGKQRSEVYAEIVQQYKDSYYIPGVELAIWYAQNPEKTPDVLKDKVVTFIGSPFIDRSVGSSLERWSNLGVKFNEEKKRFEEYGLNVMGKYSDDNIVLLKKPIDTKEQAPI